MPTARPTIAMICAAPDEPWPLLDEVRTLGDVSITVGAAAIRKALERAEVVLATDFRTRLLRDAWPAGAAVRWIHATSAGVDTIMIPQVRKSDIVVTNARGVFDPFIAEHVLGCVIAFAKDFLGNLEHQRMRRWKYRLTEPVRGKRMLVYGAGSVGAAIARLARATGMPVDGVARAPREDPNFDAVHGDRDLHELLPQADFVVAAAPLTHETHHRLDGAAFKRMKPSARFINVGRGALVDTDALVTALERGEIAGAALDVFEQEPLPSDHPLWGMPNVMVSAHQSGDIRGWREIVMRQFSSNLERWLNGEPLENEVDKDLGFIPTGSDEDARNATGD
jgi:phosphoglycerate dehydrogenase-like enzyme